MDCSPIAEGVVSPVLAQFSSDKGVNFWKNFQVSGFLFSNADLANSGSAGDYGDYAGCAFQNGSPHEINWTCPGNPGPTPALQVSSGRIGIVLSHGAKFFPLWADNSNSTNDNPSESNPNPPPTYYNP